ncbi:MAG: hypothetical protein QM739_14685 [Propionivibrio sp.]
MRKTTPATMKGLFVAATFAIAASSAGAIEISEAMLNSYVRQGLAERTQRDVQVLNPKVSLLDGYATICATVHARIFARNVDFCADMTPKWRQETGSLLATRMALTSLNAPGVGVQDVELIKAIVNQVVLPGMEGIEIYKADNFIGKQISGLKVLPGRLDLSL